MKRMLRAISFTLAMIMAVTSVDVTVLAEENDAAYEYEYEDPAYDPLDVSAGDVSGQDVSFGDLSGNDVSGDDISANDVSGDDISANDVSGGEPSANDISGGDVSDNDGLKKDLSSGDLLNDVSGNEEEETVEITEEPESNGYGETAEDWGTIEEEDRALFPGGAKTVPDVLWVAGVTDVNDYVGKAITFPNMRVYSQKTRLTLNKDYTVKYSNNVKAGTATITITGKGNFSGTITKKFTINPLSLGDVTDNDPRLTIPDIALAYNKKVQKGTTTLTYEVVSGNDVTLKAGTDFTYSYDTANYNYKTAGSYVVTVKGKGNYTGTARFTETIVQGTEQKLITKLKFGKVANQKATGEAICPEVTVMDGAYECKSSTVSGNDADYFITWQNNVSPGTARIIITGNGKTYFGYKIITFKISAISIGNAKVTGLVAKDYDGSAQVQTGYVLTYQAGKKAAVETLTEGEDYTVSYLNNVNAGKKATIVFTGINRFSGILKKTFRIYPYALPESSVEMDSDVSYQKNGAKPSVVVTVSGNTLKAGTDYTVKYTNNTKVNDGSNAKKIPTVTITGKGNYTGTIKRTFTITASSLDKVTMTAYDVVYQKKAGICKPTVTLKDENGTKLKAGTDYEKTLVYRYTEDVSVNHYDKKTKTYYEEGVSAGDLVGSTDIIPVGTTILVTATGKGNYAGSEATATFRFVAKDIAKATVKIQTQYFTGLAVEPGFDQITVTFGKGKSLITLTGQTDVTPGDYVITGYSNNVNKGTGYVYLKGVGNYGGTKTVKFTIAAKSMLYKITYNNNNDYMTEIKPEIPVATGTMKVSNITAGTKLTANAFVRKGYTFTGWNTEPDGTGYSYANKECFYNKDESEAVVQYGTKITLYAQWELTVYTITYKFGTSGVSNNNPTSYTMESPDIVLKTPYKNDNYKWGGWFTNSAHTKKITMIPSGSTGNKTLYGLFTPKSYVVYFNANSGTGKMSSITVKYDTTFCLPANTFTRSGYRFIGWGTTKKAVQYRNGSSVKNISGSEEQVTLYAIWKPKGNSNKDVIWDSLYDVIGNEYGVAGLMGNLYAESGLVPNNVQNSYEKKVGSDEQYTAAVDSGAYSKNSFITDGAGYGLAQWTYSTRKKGLYEYAKGECGGVSIGNLNMQINYLIRELYSGGYISILQNVSSIQEASDVILTRFEKPADTSDRVKAIRASYGWSIYNEMMGSTINSVPCTVHATTTLNIRSGPSTNYSIAGTVAAADYVIIALATSEDNDTNSWGKLSDGSGWICLDYCYLK